MAAPTQDIGRPDYAWGAWGQALQGDWWESASDLLWPTNVITYGRMRRDPQLTAVLNAYILPLMRARWMLDGTGCRPEVTQHVADDLGVPIVDGDDHPGPARRRGVIWRRHLRESLNYLSFGHMPFERRYHIDPDGAAHLDNLGVRSPWTIAQMNLNTDGTINQIEQNTQRPPIPANRLVWYVNNQLGANWAGESVLRPAFGAWLLKHEAWRVHATSIRRFGMGVPVVEAPPGASQQQLLQAQQMASAMRAGDQAGMAVPQGFKAAIAGMTGSVPDALAFIRYLDQSMAKMALTGLIELGQTETGSRALGDAFLDLFLLSLQTVAEEIALTATSGHPGMPGIITDIVDQNWGENEPAPRLVCLDLGESYEVTADAVSALVTCGAISPDEELDKALRERWGLPKRKTPWVPSSRGLPAGTSIKPAVEQQYAEQANAQDNVPNTKPAGDATPTGNQSRQRSPENPPRNPAQAPQASAKTPPAYIAASHWEPERHQQEYEEALARLLLQYRSVWAAQRTNLVDQVLTALQDGTTPDVSMPPTQDGASIVQQAMETLAVRAARAMMDEADQQGVHIDINQVRIDAERLGGVAAARTSVMGSWAAQQATAKALQTFGPSPEGFLAAADEVDRYLAGIQGAQLREHLGAALTAAQNAGRYAVLEAAPPDKHVTYVAAEWLDKNTCDNCRREDGHEYLTLGEAERAYPTGGYRDCQGLMRCRGTVVAVWGDESTTLPVAAKFNPLEKRDDHGKWTKGGEVKKLAADTFDMHTNDRGEFTPERKKLHEQVTRGILAGQEPQDHPVATFFGGGSGSGKSMLASQGAVIDADAIKGHLPEYRQMIKKHDPKAAVFAHEESSYIAGHTVDEARQGRLHYTLDGTGDSAYEKMAAKVEAAKKAGYTTHAKYVTVDTNVAVERAMKRAERTGRMVPESVIRDIHGSVSRVFEQAVSKQLFDHVELWDNNGDHPRLIGQTMPGGKFQVLDNKAYQAFLAKGKQ